MNLKVGDIVEFKKYEDLSFDEMALFSKDEFPQSGKVKKIIVGNKEKVIYFFIEENQYSFNPKSVSRVISDVDGVDINSFTPGEEVWVKATVNVCYDDTVFLNPVERFANKDNLKKVKREEPEHFIVQENYYGMYVGVAGELVGNKDTAQVFTSRDDANEEAADMHLNAWDVIPYDN